jgi:glycosyltransferase involved in cell wall biosynthesis
MKLIYITNSRIPTEKAHGSQIMKMCEKFSELSSVKLIVPHKINYLGQDPFTYYGIKRNFKIETLPSMDFGGKTRRFARFLFLFDLLVFAISLTIFGGIKKSDIVYTRDYTLLPFLPSRKNIVEIHDIPKRTAIFVRCLKNAELIVVITFGLKNKLISLGIEENKIIVAPDAVDLENFDIKISKNEAREKLSLPLDKKIVLYSGQLYSWKGAEVLADATNFFGDEFLTVFVGGTEPWVSLFSNKYVKNANIRVIPAQKKDLVPVYLKSADVLVLPNSGKQIISAVYTSPLKLFEYMASGRPIVASDLPSIREVLNDDNAIFFESDNSESLASAVKFVFNNLSLSEDKAKRSFSDVHKYTWEKRAGKIIDSISKLG